MTTYITIITTGVIYFALVFWARWKDRKDVEKIGCVPLPDNKPGHKVSKYPNHAKDKCCMISSRVGVIVPMLALMGSCGNPLE